MCWKKKNGTEMQLIAIQSSQHSASFRAIIHCATRLEAKKKASSSGDASSTSRRIRKRPSHPRSPTATRMPASRGGVRDTLSSVLWAPPCSHTYQPYTDTPAKNTWMPDSPYSFCCRKITVYIVTLISEVGQLQMFCRVLRNTDTIPKPAAAVSNGLIPKNVTAPPSRWYHGGR